MTLESKIQLTPHQQDALDQILDMKHEVVALRGLAGTGKTSMIPAIAAELHSEPVIAAPTHRAAQVLRGKGLVTANTLHKACLRPMYSEPFENFRSWIKNPDSRKVPGILAKLDPAVVIEKINQCGRDFDLACVAFNLDPMDYVTGWTARDMDLQSVLIVDEASMVGANMLDQALQVFQKIILVGDPGQLRPVKDVPILEHAHGVELREIHRQAEGSPIIEFAHSIRNSGDDGFVDPPDGIRHAHELNIENGPVIVYLNKTRRALNVGLRRRAGYPADKLVKGEPLVCKATAQCWIDKGLVNNSMWTYEGDNSFSNGAMSLKLDKVHIEGIDDRDPHFTECKFQLGHAITAHTAQGSEWDQIQVYVNEAMAFERQNSREEAKKWLYTAVTRAKEELFLVQT